MNNQQVIQTLDGRSISAVPAQGVLSIPTSHPRKFLVIDMETGDVFRGARAEYAFRTNLKAEDVATLVAVTRKVAASHGITLAPAAPALPTTFVIPGNGVTRIDEMSEAELLLAIALEGEVNGSSTLAFKALSKEQKNRNPYGF